MLCQICKQKEATGHYVQVIGSTKVLELYICDDCAKKMLESRRAQATFGQKGVSDWLSSVVAQAREQKDIDLACPNCGKKYLAFVKDNYIGCPACYIAFKERLGAIINEFSLSRESTESLKSDLERAIQEERFEDAAKIRDYLKSQSQKSKNIQPSD
ncbi:MAG TPA: UvrB/UvrC motif-containing protein [Caldisericia bacterium]|nr:UvrB/UvrC motif-containing protein [Caldisericia bacterium]HOU08337.1 UvrB/UvrC motif-containing protein [Caldisericia bacterium]HPL88814.1 UvrB/UvrC motif-containing protein [Caldisericia bacterium]HQG59922.1 UvrB/UvrC motif-containing protein [Caldisericia bacterium]HQH48508.1 UvrB/UvrC motif-containing protein [Caldisericia bacterium]